MTAEPAGQLTRGEDEPKADHDVLLVNQSPEARLVHVRVVRSATGEAVFARTETIAPNTEQVVYNLERADPAGIEAFTVCGRLVPPSPTPTGATPAPTGSGATEAAPHRDCVTLRTDACTGIAEIVVREDDELQIVHSIC